MQSPFSPTGARSTLQALVARARARVQRWWQAMDRRERVHTVLLGVFALGIAAHQLAFLFWYVEDAAISFAYARNAVQGEGLVSWVGGERVEGYSNPTWVALLALMQLPGQLHPWLYIDPFDGVKWVQLALALATLPAVYWAVQEATGKESDAPLFAGAFLGASSQFAIWGAAGLENALLNCLMAYGIWRMMVEARTGGTPWSALLWMLVALSRPEAILYAALAGGWSMLLALHARRSLLSTVQWLLLFFVPWTAYQAWHYWYFAWPLPNTYYAKLGEREWVHWLWNDKAWKWTRRFYHEMYQGYFLPVWLFGVLGDGRWRTPLVAGLTAVLGVLLQVTTDQRYLLPVLVGVLWFAFALALQATGEKGIRRLLTGSALGGLALFAGSELARYAFAFTPTKVPVPELLSASPPYILASLALALPLLGVGARGWQLRGFAWLSCCASTAFAVYVQWDWMTGFRWYATAVVPGAILFAFGVDAIVQLLERLYAQAEVPAIGWRRYTRGGVAVGVGLVALQVLANVPYTVVVAMKPDTSPRSVLTRVRHVWGIRDRLHLEERLVDLDVDQGAHLWWSGFEMMDIAGLIEVPFAHQHFEKPFVTEYLFTEKRPHYAHVHGEWANNTKIPANPEWRKQYIGIPGYPAGVNEHIGSFIRRDLVVSPAWPRGQDSAVQLDGDIVLYGPYVPSEPAVGKMLYVEVGAAAKKLRKLPQDNFRWVLFASRDGAVVASWDIPPGYDWLEPNKWTATEVFVGKFDLPLPAAMAPGVYDLGMVVFASDGSVVGAAVGDARSVGPAARIGGEEGEPALFAPGEVHYPGALTVLAVDARDRASESDRADALAKAKGEDCAAAEQAWWLSRKHRPVDKEWVEAHQDEMASAFAACWALASDGLERAERVDALVRAHDWDHWSPEYLARAVPLADELYAEGLAAREAGDWETAYRAFSDAVDIDRSRSWARRYAEEARAFRLGIDEASLAEKAAAEAERKKAAAERTKNARERSKAARPKDPVEDDGGGDAGGDAQP